jgi:queuine tRNA-ribosyltransferase
MTLRFTIEAAEGDARVATVATARGRFTTPCFMPVGTRGAVRSLSSVDLADLGAEVVLANTYHLMLRPGVDVVAGVGGLHRFMAWDGHLLTDSGGFQVFSLDPGGNVEVDDDGVSFRSVYDGSRHRLTPELAVDAQERLGADIQMALDVCPPLPSPAPVVRLAAGPASPSA